MTASRIGPYRLLGPLGEGGMGVVWRARHEQTGSVVALKTVHAPDESSIGSIRREIRALGRIRHPGIVRILDDGVHEGLPWYAMELLEGRTFRDVLRGRAPALPATVHASTELDGGRGGTVTREMSEAERNMAAARARGAAESLSAAAPRGPATPPFVETLAIVRDLCGALSHLHGRGLVHRDLKPDNVFVRDDGAPVLVDLGIASAFAGVEGREEVAVAGRVMGSVAYMAPEQIRGDLVDARADLYALGCVLYECLTGAPPFAGTDGAWVVHAHLFDAPLPPSARVDGIPEALDRLVLRLLEKRPGDRLGYAEDVAEALRPFVEAGSPGDEPAGSAGSGGGGVTGAAEGTGAQEHVADMAPLSSAPAYVYRADFSGREDVLARFATALDQLAVFKGGRWLVAGESGAGKTRLLLEMSRAAVRRRISVVSAQCEPVLAGAGGDGARVGAPLSAIRPLLTAMADRCRAMGAGETSRVFGPRAVGLDGAAGGPEPPRAERARILAPYEPSLATLPGVEGEPEPPALPPDAARARVLRAVTESARALTAGEPWLLLADDLQWADELSLAFLEALGRPETAAPGLLVVGAYRAEEADGALSALAASSDVESVHLPRLGEPDVRRIVADMLALRDPPGALVRFLTDVSSGNPFFLGEYLRAAIGEGLLARDRAGTWQLRRAAPGRIAEVVPFPERIAELVERRLAGLGGAVRPLVEAASVVGREMEGPILLAVAGVEEGAALDAIETLRVRQVLEEPRPGVLRFVHDKLRETAYARIGPGERLELHRRAAAAIEARYGDGPEVAGVLGRHHAQSGQAARAAVLFERAAEHARARYANEEAIGHYRAAIEHVERAGAAGKKVPEGAGDTASGPAGKSLPGDPGRDLPGLAEKLGDVLALVGRHAEARGAFEHGLGDLREGQRIDRARLWRKIGKTWEILHEHAEALRALDRAERSLSWTRDASETAEQDLWVQLQIDRISVHYWEADLGRIDSLVESVRPLVERFGTLEQRANFFQALIHRNLRRERYVTSAETVEYSRKCLLAREQLGDPRQTLTTRFALAAVLLWHGALAEAEERMAAALAEAELVGDAHHEARCLTYLCILLRLRGQVTEARDLVERSLEVARRAQLADLEGAAFGNRAWLALRDGDPERAWEAGSEALSRWQPISSAYAFPFQWTARLVLMALDVERERPGSAIEHARAMTHEKQQRLPDEISGALHIAIAALEQGSARLSIRPLREALQAAKKLRWL